MVYDPAENPDSARRGAIDPDPAVTPGLDEGGQVQIGDTPPESAQTSGLSKPEEPLHSRFPPTGVAALLAIVGVVIVFGIVIVGLVLMIL
ncbi:DUF6480 family protein [Gordonia sp. HY285]|uniref:DUF6480 family protein n=1 Tax=Gordonia liuliyuniae TaxID=2911517 RepID=UPI001F414608|nr:DUF6480 family protein [Gordonia liuliyuniae]MCF8610518.1 DUF6480 family protein [Gordonia liuliyuniae]